MVFQTRQPDQVTAAFLCQYSYSCDSKQPYDFTSCSSAGVTWSDCSALLRDWTVIRNSVSDAEAVCCRDPSGHTTFVAFRGTESFRDAAADIWVTKRRIPFKAAEPEVAYGRLYRNARVHTGFLFQFASIKTAFDHYVQANPGDRVVLCGHSLGGALALIAALYMRLEHPARSVSTEVFGCPRVGNSAFSALVDSLTRSSPVRRHVYGRDPIARMPHRIRWKHCGVCYTYGASPRVDVSEDDADGFLGGCLSIPSPFRADDHVMERYIDSVCEASITENRKNISRALCERLESAEGHAPAFV